MSDRLLIEDYIAEVSHELPEVSPVHLAKLMSVIDLTRLEYPDSDQAIISLCDRASNVHGRVAGICVYSDYISLVKSLGLNSAIAIATVANFPGGDSPVEHVVEEISSALKRGASEVDVVLPYQTWLSGDVVLVKSFLEKCRSAAGSAILKVILEVGAYPDLSSIASAARLVYETGGDFVKTSTGKIAKGASLEAAGIILTELKRWSQHTSNDRACGIKISGGVKSISSALRYVMLAERMLDREVDPSWFRIGASQLVDMIAQS